MDMFQGNRNKENSYLINVWKNKFDKENGMSTIILDKITTLEWAITIAQARFKYSHYYAVEVQRESDNEPMYFKDEKEEKYFIEIDEIQEEVGLDEPE